MDLQAVDGIAPALGEWLEQAREYRVNLLIHNAATLNLGCHVPGDPQDIHVPEKGLHPDVP